MATISLAPAANTAGHPANSYHKVPYLVEAYIDLAAAAAAKGSALAAADVIEAIRIPGKSLVTVAGVEVITAVGGGGTVLTIDVGTGTDVDAFADGFDLFAATAGAMSVKPAAGVVEVVQAAGDTVDVLIATQTGVFNSGVIRVWALVTDLVAVTKPGLVKLGS